MPLVRSVPPTHNNRFLSLGNKNLKKAQGNTRTGGLLIFSILSLFSLVSFSSSAGNGKAFILLNEYSENCVYNPIKLGEELTRRKNQINCVFSNHGRALGEIWSNHQRNGFYRTVKVSVALTINEDGTVSDVTIENSSIDNEDLHTKLVSYVQKMMWPKLDGVSWKGSYNFNFHSRNKLLRRKNKPERPLF